MDPGISRCTLLHLEWINNKLLLYSTRNYIQSPGINHNGKEFFKKNIYIHTHIYIMHILHYTTIYIYIHIYVCESLCCTTEISRTL